MRVNGHHITLQNPVSLSDFLKKEGYDAQRVAVEKNGNIVPKKSFDSEMLNDNDKLEVVCFVGGG